MKKKGGGLAGSGYVWVSIAYSQKLLALLLEGGRADVGVLALGQLVEVAVELVGQQRVSRKQVFLEKCIVRYMRGNWEAGLGGYTVNVVWEMPLFMPSSWWHFCASICTEN